MVVGTIAALAGQVAAKEMIKDMNIWQWVRNLVSEEKIGAKCKEEIPKIAAAIQAEILKKDEVMKTLRSETQRAITEVVAREADQARLHPTNGP